MAEQGLQNEHVDCFINSTDTIMARHTQYPVSLATYNQYSTNSTVHLFFHLRRWADYIIMEVACCIESVVYHMCLHHLLVEKQLILKSFPHTSGNSNLTSEQGSSQIKHTEKQHIPHFTISKQVRNRHTQGQIRVVSIPHLSSQYAISITSYNLEMKH